MCGVFGFQCAQQPFQSHPARSLDEHRISGPDDCANLSRRSRIQLRECVDSIGRHLPCRFACGERRQFTNQHSGVNLRLCIDCRQVPADLVNLIEYNPIDFASFRKPSPEKVEAFMQYLEKHRVNVRLRRSRGKDIDAACGQLANKG